MRVQAHHMKGIHTYMHEGNAYIDQASTIEGKHTLFSHYGTARHQTCPYSNHFYEKAVHVTCIYGHVVDCDNYICVCTLFEVLNNFPRGKAIRVMYLPL